MNDRWLNEFGNVCWRRVIESLVKTLNQAKLVLNLLAKLQPVQFV